MRPASPDIESEFIQRLTDIVCTAPSLMQVLTVLRMLNLPD